MAAALQAAGVVPGDKVGSCWPAPPGHLRPVGGAAGGRRLRAARPRAAAGAPGPYSAAGEVKTLITQAEYRHKLASLFEGRTLLAGDLVSDNRLNQPAAGRAVAYLMFTSGSTGLPKGWR